MDRAAADALDDADALAVFRGLFVGADDPGVYALGNSLGRLPKATAARIEELVRHEWGGDLVAGWSEWIDLPTTVGDRLGSVLLGAAPGQVALADSTTVNLHRLVTAALTAAAPARTVIVTDRGNFPTDRYALASVGTVRWIDHPDQLSTALDDDVALVSFSHVDYRTAEVHDIAGVTATAHAAGARVLWDLSHAVGSVPLAIDGAGVDLAVGCTYKYLNAGPGAPAFQYVRADLIDELPVALTGWFGQADQFGMGPAFEPRAGIARFLSGTPNVLGIAAVDCGVAVHEEAGVAALRGKSLALTGLAITLFDEWLDGTPCALLSPRPQARRAAHIALTHPAAPALVDVLRRRGVVADHRAPDIVRLAFAPLYTSFADVWDALDAVRAAVANRG